MIDIDRARRYNAQRITAELRDRMVEAIGGQAHLDVELVATFQDAHNYTVIESGLERELLDVDGMFGPATRSAVLAARLDADPDVQETPDLTAPMPEPIEPPPAPLFRAERFSGRPELLPNMVDRRRRTTPTYEGRRYTPDVRGIGDVWGWCLHQTAVLYGDQPHERNDTTNAHFLIRRDRYGTILWLHDLDLELWAANLFNARTVSIEVEARACGIEGDRRTLWKPHLGVAEATDVQLEQLDALVRWGTALITVQGGRPRVLVAHRQSSGNRDNDPGSRIWAVAVRLQAELELHDGGEPGHGPASVGTGSPIPVEWNPARVGFHYR